MAQRPRRTLGGLALAALKMGVRLARFAMAERERRSKPRKMEPTEEDAKHNWWYLAMWLVGAVAVIEVMYLVSQFLSGGGDKIASWVYALLAVTVVVTVAFWFAGRMADRKQLS